MNCLVLVKADNVGTMRGRSREVVKVLTRRKIDLCCVQKVRGRGTSARLVTEKNTGNMFFLLWK